MKVSRSNLAVSATALACAGVFGGVFAVALVGQQPDRDQTVVRTVSDEAGAEATPSGQASPAATQSASATTPVQTSSTTNGSQTVTEPAPTTQPAPAEPAPADPTPTEPAPTQPAPEPVAPPAGSGGESGPPVGAGPPPGPGFQCLPQEYGINPRCPAPSPTS